MTKITQVRRDGIWIDESGIKIPYNRTTKVERLMERSSAKILKGAKSINKTLKAFKTEVKRLCQEAYDAFMDEKEITKVTKGNFTWYNFNRMIKIEVNVNERIEFDDLTIDAAKAKLDEFLDKNIDSKNQFAKELVLGAFETQRNNKLDTKKVLGLSRYEKRIQDPTFSEAIELINQSIRRPDTKTYFRVWLKDEDGKYQNVDLNFSSI